MKIIGPSQLEPLVQELEIMDFESSLYTEVDIVNSPHGIIAQELAGVMETPEFEDWLKAKGIQLTEYQRQQVIKFWTSEEAMSRDETFTNTNIALIELGFPLVGEDTPERADRNQQIGNRCAIELIAAVAIPLAMLSEHKFGTQIDVKEPGARMDTIVFLSDTYIEILPGWAAFHAEAGKAPVLHIKKLPRGQDLTIFKALINNAVSSFYKRHLLDYERGDVPL